MNVSSSSRASRAARMAGRASLVASLVPGAAFGALLLVASGTRRFGWLAHPPSWPWELYVVGLAGAAATAAGVLDWRFHRREGVVVGPNERRAELLALTLGGLPMFALMVLASVLPRPSLVLLPLVAVVALTATLITYDEVAFHRRRCGGYETVLHRVLVFGHALALLAWMHFSFVRGSLG